MPLHDPHNRRLPIIRAKPLCQLAIIVGLTFLIAGCWDRTEVNDLAVVLGTALDMSEDGLIEVTLSLAVPGGGTTPGSTSGRANLPPTVSIRGRGRTVTDAISLIQTKVSRNLLFSHNAIILIGEELARQGIVSHLDFFSRNREPRIRALIGVVPGKAGHVFDAAPPIQRLTPLAVESIALMRHSVLSTVRDFLIAEASDGEEPLLARVELVSGEATHPVNGGGPPSSEREHLVPAITGGAVFKGGKLVGFLDQEEVRGALWIRNELERGTVTIPVVEQGAWVSLEVVRSTSRIEPRLKGDQITMWVKIITESDLDSNSADLDLKDPTVIRLVQERVAAVIEERMRTTVEIAQHQFKSDILRFGEAVRRADPKRWNSLRERWDEVFPNVEIQFDVQIFIRRTGLISRPLGVQPEDLKKAKDIREGIRSE